MTDTLSTSSPAQSGKPTTADLETIALRRDIPYQIAATTPALHGLPLDTLRTIFEGQRQLMVRLHHIEEQMGSHVVDTDDLGDISGRRVQMRLHELFGYMVRELGEAMQHLHSKPWKKQYQATNRAEFEEEMVDSFHFFVEMCITGGISADRLFELYFAKWETNHVRQDTGY